MRPNADRLVAEVECTAERLDALRGSAFVFWMDVHGPVPRRDMEAAAVSAYGDMTRVTGVEPVTAQWRSEVREAARRMGHFAELFEGEARREPEFLVEWVLEIIEDTLGPVRAAGRVTHRPTGWYATLWEDWILLTDEWALVLSLTNDS
ncbi:hypothetical protein FE391_19265 [Nonomuraea sp. KC401]|uniref:hypothetical protein n=1 Tax=unclassified Nonomuraea TaxID=2593643 RepID=UPI0010FE855A|nr:MULTISPECIES: hypothetical protein [unclassified Nonomuraea]NBE98033.1 hypothetical protein [Nonomuraea sp. K271]TLF71461.1 hypothetical protein FE391_19265 [Nonomuraea sp. KC401]